MQNGEKMIRKNLDASIITLIYFIKSQTKDGKNEVIGFMPQ
jgi:hypothetical protein